MHEEHESFMEWAAGYENRAGHGRNATTDRAFLETRCGHFLALSEAQAMEEIVREITRFLVHSE